jgi:hypothetical protein
MSENCNGATAVKQQSRRPRGTDGFALEASCIMGSEPQPHTAVHWEPSETIMEIARQYSDRPEAISRQLKAIQDEARWILANAQTPAS